MRNIGHDRREFIAQSFCLAGAALAVSGLRPLAAQAQTAPRPIRRSERYDDLFITERKLFKWPGNSTLAVWDGRGRGASTNLVSDGRELWLSGSEAAAPAS